MEIQTLNILFRLIIAHLLADFVFQTNRIASGKEKGLRSSWFWIHMVIVGITTYVLLLEWRGWKTALTLVFLHGLIDWIKIKIKSTNVGVFVGDQLLHIASIFLVWCLFYEVPVAWLEPFILALGYPENLLIVIGFLTVTWPMSYLIGGLTRSWQTELSNSKTP